MYGIQKKFVLRGSTNYGIGDSPRKALVAFMDNGGTDAELRKGPPMPPELRKGLGGKAQVLTVVICDPAATVVVKDDFSVFVENMPQRSTVGVRYYHFDYAEMLSVLAIQPDIQLQSDAFGGASGGDFTIVVGKMRNGDDRKRPGYIFKDSQGNVFVQQGASVLKDKYTLHDLMPRRIFREGDLMIIDDVRYVVGHLDDYSTAGRAFLEGSPEAAPYLTPKES